MRIKEAPPKQLLFRDLKPGDLCRTEDGGPDIWMKIEPFRPGSGTGTDSIRLRDGCRGIVGAGTRVMLVSGAFVEE